MDIVKLSISRPVGVAVGVILVVMFGFIGAGAIPVQLTPTVDRPIVTVTTGWPGRTPQEVVDEITKEQEEELKNVSNLKHMRSVSREGEAEIELEFYLEADINRALQEVSDALRQVGDYPEEVEEPAIAAADGASENAIAWIILDVHPDARAKHSGFDITTLYDALDKEVKPYIERIDGVAEVNIFGGREREVRLELDPARLADRSLTHIDVIEALRAQNQNVSAGTIAEGKRDYRVRVTGQYTTTDEILETIVAYRDGGPVFVKDLGTAELSYEKQRGFVRSRGVQVIAINIIRQTGANVMDIMAETRLRLDEIRSEILPNIGGSSPAGGIVGPDLRMTQVYDETTYISSSIDLVTQNLWIGGSIAALVLLLFLRSFIATGVIALAIPIAIVGTFLVLLALGRTLNVISLAGLAFAVGMVVDNAIVVLENIDRRRRMGDGRLEAAYKGGREVWGAVLASTLTTAAVFVPVLTIAEEAGQLFRDISIAIVASVSLSLIVSITVIPAACSRWLGDHREPRSVVGKAWAGLFGVDRVFGGLNRALSGFVRWCLTGVAGWTVRPLIIVAMTILSLGGSYMLLPPMDYLPAGNRNLVFGGLLIPPGLSIDQRTIIAERIETVVEPYRVDEFSPDMDGGPIDRGFDQQFQPIPAFDAVPVENFFIAAFGGGMFAGATSGEEEVVIPVGQLLTNAMQGIPDTFGGARQTSLFGRGIGGGNTIDVEISGPNLSRVTDAANMVFGTAAPKYGYGNVRPNPGNFNLTQPEWRVRLNDAGRELGLTNAALGTAVRALFDGAFAGEFRFAADTIDIMLVPRGGRLEYKEQLASVPVRTPAGPVVPLDTVVELVPSTAPQEIRRVEELSAVTIQISPPQGRAVEELMEEIDREIIEPARQAGLIDRTMRVRLEGTAAKLDEVQAALFGKPQPGSTEGPVASALKFVSFAVGIAGIGVAVFVLIRGVARRDGRYGYGVFGALLLAVTIGGLIAGVAWTPELLAARSVWALAVTYLLMAALFESFVYPFVIMFSVPLAIVGGFAGLRIVHDWSVADPTKAPQLLDVLTMLGFIILVGVVVNNAILLVHQALNFMRGEDGNAMEPADAIAEAVRTRIRPIFMSSLTSVGGMLPLVLFPGAGSEMYRGLGSVVVGGLLCSTIFTLMLVPLVFSLTYDMLHWLSAAFRPASKAISGDRSGPSFGSGDDTPDVSERSKTPAAEPALA
ncbi:MAG: efflux RND transporter permease subunit [Planctomycetota bacterium]